MLDVDGILRPHFDRLVEAVGEVPLFDAHTHVGANDPDGFRQSPEQLLANLVAGTPDMVVEKLQQYEALGVDHFIIYGAVGNDHATTMKSLTLFAERVMPHFRQGGPS